MQTNSRDSQCICRNVGTERRHLRRSNVARGPLVLAMTVILSTVLLSSTGGAQETQLGQLCWRFNAPFADTLRLAISQLPGPAATDALLFEVNVRWRATAGAVGGQTVGGPGPVTYQLLGTGTFALENATPPTGNVDLGFEAVQIILPPSATITHFGGNLTCNFVARLSLATLNGPWRVQCPGPTHFTNSGTLTFVACPDAQF